MHTYVWCIQNVIFGDLQCLDMDVNDERVLISSNFLTWVVVSNALFEYPKDPVFEHLVRFYFFCFIGLNLINPFYWVTLAWTISGVVWFEKVSNKGFAKKNGIYPHLHYLSPRPRIRKRFTQQASIILAHYFTNRCYQALLTKATATHTFSPDIHDV